MLAVSINSTANRIATARLVYQDGNAASSDFPLSNADTFVPGAEVEILAGSSDESVSLFKGIITRHSLKVRSTTAPQLIIECKHKAAKLTVGRRSAYYTDQPDSDIIAQLFADADIDTEVDTTSVTYKHQVQYNATDWDFCLLRAEANGLLVLPKVDAVHIKAPQLDTPVCTLLFGATILDADLQIDARYQYSSVKAVSWDPAGQSLVEKEAEDPGIDSPGNLDAGNLAGALELEDYRLSHPSIGEDEAQQWADAAWVYSQVNRVTGSVKCEGIGVINVGDTATLAGLGDRFNGDAYVAAVRHDFDLVQGWKTHIQFGGIESLVEHDKAIHAEPASGLLPAVNGLQIGIVVSNEDPDGEHRVQVKMPLVDNDEDGTWARVASLDAGDERGFFFRPEVGDEVVLGFFADDPRQAVVLGMLHSSAKPAPLEGSDDNHEKAYQSRSKMKVSFDDDKIVMKLETPAGNSITLSEEDQHIKLEDQHGNLVEMNSDGITIESSKALTLKAGTEVKLESGTAFEVKGGTELKLEGSASAEISSTATTKVSGSLVQIN